MLEWLIIPIVIITVFTIVKYHRNKYIRERYVPLENSLRNKDEIELVRLINEYRQSLGLNVLKVELRSSGICELTVDKCIREAIDVNHYNALERVAGTGAIRGGEICGQGFSSALGFFNAYIKSTDHKRIIENPGYEWIGISIKNKINYCILTKY